MGQAVQIKVDPRRNNGLDYAAGLVTKVTSGEDDNETTANVRVFLDTGADDRVTNVKIVGSRPDEDADVDTDASGTQKVAWTSTK